MLHVSKCRFDRTRPRVGREREREKVRGGGGRRGRVDLLKEGRKERNKKKKKKSTQLPGRATVLQPLASEADECEVL